MADWQFLTDFHFIRPLWLLGLLPAVLCYGLIKKINQQTGNWEKVINPTLLPYLMQDGLDSNSYAKYFHRCLALCWLLFCLLGGPIMEPITTTGPQRRFSLGYRFRLISFNAC